MTRRIRIAKPIMGFATVAGLMAGLILSPSPTAAATLLVVNDGTPDLSAPCNTNPTHPTIEVALTAAQPGDTIAVCPGIYNEDVTINKPNLTLNAVQGNVQFTGLVGTQEGVVDIFAAGVTLHGFEISSVNQGKWGVRLLAGSEGSKIDGNQVNQNDFGGILVESGNNEILNNEANSNGGNGIQVDSGSTGNKVHTNLTNFNSSSGISVEGSNNQIYNNTSDENKADGISVSGDRNSVFTAPMGLTLVDDNFGNGIFVSGYQNIIGPGVEAIENGLDGIHLSADSFENQVLQNVVGGSLNSGGNDRYGIHVAGVSNLVKGNAVEDNAESGVYLVGQGNDVLRNSVCQNGAQLQNGTDINVTLSAENNTVRHNQASKIVVSNSNNMVKNNKRCR